MSSDGKLQWPENFMDIGGRTFDWVYDNRKEWVDFTKTKMDKPTGLFKEWKLYVLQKSKCLQESTQQNFQENTGQD
jgi:hypothetical protein